jgi:hypothetical protein
MRILSVHSDAADEPFGVAVGSWCLRGIRLPHPRVAPGEPRPFRSLQRCWAAYVRDLPRRAARRRAPRPCTSSQAPSPAALGSDPGAWPPPRRRWPGCGGRGDPTTQASQEPRRPGSVRAQTAPCCGQASTAIACTSCESAGSGRWALAARLSSGDCRPRADTVSGVGVRGAAPVPRRRWVAVGGER